MSLLSRRGPLTVAIFAILLLITAVAGALILTQSSKADEVELTTAQLVPADASIYIALNTDLPSSQWVSAFKLIKRLGTDDPEGELKSNASLADLDWETEVAPFLGGDSAVFLTSFDFSDFQIEGAILLKCSDSQKAMNVFMTKSGESFKDGKHNGTPYRAGDTTYIARLDSHLVIASSEKTLFNVIDVQAKKAPSLAASADFAKLHDELSKNFLGFVYINGDALTKDLFSDEDVRRAVDQAGAGGLAFKPAAMALGASGDTFSWQAASTGDPGAIGPIMAPRKSHLVDIAPAKSAVFVSTTNVKQTWDEVLKRAKPEIDKAVASDGQYRNLDDALRQSGRQLGLNSVSEIIDLLTGETAVAVWYPSNLNQAGSEWLVMADVSDPAAAGRVMDTVFAASAQSGRPAKADIAGVSITTITSDGDQLSYAIQNGHLLLGTPAAVKGAVSGSLGSLSADPKYRRTLAQVPGGDLGSFAYLDIATLAQQTAGDFIDTDIFGAKTGGLIINLVSRNGVARLSGTQLIEK